MYVNEIDETLSLCFHETPRLTGRVEEVFDIHLSATEVLVRDPLGLRKARYTTRMHRLFVMEDLWQGFFMVRRRGEEAAGACLGVRVCQTSQHQSDLHSKPRGPMSYSYTGYGHRAPASVRGPVLIPVEDAFLQAWH